jgi:cell division transport system permease protein
MRTWVRLHWLSLTQTLTRLARTPGATLLNVLVIGIALALPLGGYCVIVNLQSVAGNISTEPEVSVFLATDATRADIAGVESKVKAAEGVKAVRFVSRDAALSALKRDPAMTEMVATLRDNPLPDALVVSLGSHDPQLADRLEREFRTLPKVAHVQVDSAWLQRLGALLRFGRTAVVLLASLLCFALVAVTFNTIRLQILTRAEEIEVSRLIGATDAYIRRPFVYFGATLGTLGGVASLIMVAAALFWLNRDIAPLASLYGTAFRLEALGLAGSLVVTALSAGLGWLGAALSVRAHLRAPH